MQTGALGKDHGQARPAHPALRFLAASELLTNGFPQKIVEGFLATADSINSVVCSRCPGGPAASAIDAGHALKSYYFHGKSCDWGPMAGFVCQLPPLNKKGAKNAAFNLTNHLHSIDLFKHLNADRSPRGSSPFLVDWPFLPVSISDERLHDPTYVDQSWTKKISDTELCGLAWHVETDDKKTKSWPTVLVEFYARRAAAPDHTQRWSIYHRQVWVKQDAGFEPYLEMSGKQLGLADPTAQKESRTLFAHSTAETFVAISAGVVSALDDLRRRWAAEQKLALAEPKLPADQVYPVCGAQNPYRSYDANDPRNVVVGDYDLFAIWPRRSDTIWGDVVRRTESKSRQPENMAAAVAAAASGRLFHPAPRRHFTLVLNNAPGICLEVIPNVPEGESWEHPVMGNINDTVFDAAQRLNSWVTALYGRRKDAPNAAFHSDEGGRPDVNEIDYPVAVFMPKTLCADDHRALVLNGHSEFLAVLEWLDGQCLTPLNFGWMTHLLADMAPTARLDSALSKAEGLGMTEKVAAAMKKFFESRKEGRQKLVDAGSLEPLRLRTANLLLGANEKVASPTSLLVLDAAIDTFVDVALLQMNPKTKAVDMVTRILKDAGPP